MGNFDCNRIDKNGKPKSSYDDTELRNIFIEFAKNTLNVEYTHGTKYGIDLIRVDKPICGAEGEDGSWEGNRWDSNQRNIFNLKVNTLNIQNRKWHFWGLSEWSDKNKGNNNKIHAGFDDNIYFRINRNGDQICIVDSKTIRDFRKIHVVLNETVSNSREPEDWICIPEEYVMTYNKQEDGSWLLNGKYCGITQDEIERRKKEIEDENQNEEIRKLKIIKARKKLQELNNNE